jgi:hypothetical protein
MEDSHNPPVVVDPSCDETTLPDLSPDERERSLSWWRKFKMLDRLNWLGIGLILTGPLASYYHLSKDWQLIAFLGLIIFLATRIRLRRMLRLRFEPEGPARDRESRLLEQSPFPEGGALKREFVFSVPPCLRGELRF